MNSSTNVTDAQLLDYSLGLLDEAAAVAVQRQLEQNPSLARRLEIVRGTLSPLNALSAAEPPTDLADRIMRNIGRAQPLSYVAAKSKMSPVNDQPVVRRRGLPNLRELIAIAACIAILVSVFGTGVRSSVNSRNMQTKCAANLASLFRGIGTYAAEYDGRLPQAPEMAQASWLYGNDKPFAPNRRNLGPALEQGHVQLANLLCPGSPARVQVAQSNDRKWRLTVVTLNPAWYSLQNLNGRTPSMNSDVVLPLVSDANPLFPENRFSSSHAATRNSQLHDGRGQNVGFLDGSVRFVSTPVLEMGQWRDNIWQSGSRTTYTGSETPESATDAFLIP